MRLLLLNPNTSRSLTERMAAVARAHAAPGTDVVEATAPRGFPYISSRAEAAVAGSLVLEMIAEQQDVDAVIIAAFGDPGLVPARELFDMPIVGMADAAMLTACALGERFAIVTFAHALAAWFHEGVARAGLLGRYTGVSWPDAGFSSVDTVQDELADALVATVARAADAGADVAILAGAPLAGLAPKVADRLAIPAVDPIAAALLQAEALVRLGTTVPQRGAFARPPAKPSTGLPPALAARIAHR